MDVDPAGVGILRVLAGGSKVTKHENDKLVARSLQWVGPKHRDLAALGPSASKPMGKEDRLKVGFLGNPWSLVRSKKLLGEPGTLQASMTKHDSTTPSEWKPELQAFLDTNEKGHLDAFEPKDLVKMLHGDIFRLLQQRAESTGDATSDLPIYFDKLEPMIQGVDTNPTGIPPIEAAQLSLAKELDIIKTHHDLLVSSIRLVG